PTAERLKRVQVEGTQAERQHVEHCDKCKGWLDAGRVRAPEFRDKGPRRRIFGSYAHGRIYWEVRRRQKGGAESGARDQVRDIVEQGIPRESLGTLPSNTTPPFRRELILQREGLRVRLTTNQFLNPRDLVHCWVE